VQNQIDRTPLYPICSNIQTICLLITTVLGKNQTNLAEGKRKKICLGIFPLMRVARLNDGVLWFVAEDVVPGIMNCILP